MKQEEINVWAKRGARVVAMCLLVCLWIAIGGIVAVLV